MRNDGIIEVRCGEDYCYDVKDLKELIGAYKELTDNGCAPLLHLMGKYTSITKEAREYGGTNEATKHSKAEAYVLESLSQRIIGNFYLKFNNPQVPTRFFNNSRGAEIWLKTFL